jgi:catechol 2,3-dioxygenase-like lactoylglutathione lyase family enzyme
MAACSSRAVFFVRNAPRALGFYTDELGFSLDWTYEHEGKPYVFQVSFLGLELILNQTEPDTDDRPGHGRVFIGLDSDQASAFKQHIENLRVKTTHLHWGAPTIAIHDLDQNELFFWLPEVERGTMDAGAATAA